MRDYIRGLLGPGGRTNGWQLADHAGHRTPDHLQRLLNRVRWKADELRDGLQHYVAERLSEPGGILILDDTASSRRAPPPPACSTSTPGPPAAPRTARSVSTPPTPPHADAPWWTGFIAADPRQKGQQKWFLPRAPHRGRSSAAPGNCHLTRCRWPVPDEHARAEMVSLAPTAPSRRSPMSLSAAAAHDRGAAREREHGSAISPLQ
nr:transposase [Streptomyces sp. MA5143a]